MDEIDQPPVLQSNLALAKGEKKEEENAILHDIESLSIIDPNAMEPIPPSHQSTDSLRAWMQVFSAFFVFFTTWGLLLGFGALQTYYEQELLSSYSSSAIAWISTTSGFLLLFSGLITGPLYDHGYLQVLLVCGSIIEIFGLMMTSLATEYYQIYLAQGVCIGIGSGMLYVPSISAAAASFGEAQRPLVIGIIVSGSGLGGVVYPIVFRQLQLSVGFGWAVRSMAFIALATFLLSFSILPFKPKKSPAVRRFIDAAAFKDTPFLLFVLSGFFSAIGYYIPLIYLPSYAETAIPNFSNASLAFYLVAIVNGTSIFGRIAAGAIASKLGPIPVCTLALSCCVILLFSWTGVHNTAGLVVWAVLWGIVSGVIVWSPGAIIPLLSPSLSVIGTRIGMYWAAVGLGILIGSPVAGAILVYKSSGVIWWHLQVFAGFSMAIGTVLTICPWIYVARRR